MPVSRSSAHEIVAVSEKHAVFIDCHAAMPIAALRRACRVRVEGPDLSPSLRIQGQPAELGRGGVKDATPNDGIALDLRAFEGIVRVVGPRDFQALHVRGRDLRQLGIANVLKGHR